MREARRKKDKEVRSTNLIQSKAQDACKNGPCPSGDDHRNQTWNNAQSKGGAASEYA
jgi:hypothetical protein